MQVQKYDFLGGTFAVVNVFIFEHILRTAQSFMARLIVSPSFTQTPAFYGLLVCMTFIMLLFFSSFATIVVLLSSQSSEKERHAASLSQINKTMVLLALIFVVSMFLGM